MPNFELLSSMKIFLRPLLFSKIILQCNLLTVISVIKTSDSFPLPTFISCSGLSNDIIYINLFLWISKVKLSNIR